MFFYIFYQILSFELFKRYNIIIVMKEDEMNNFKTYNNRGMLLEKIINNTIHFYMKNEIAFFNKKNLDIKFKKVINSNVTILENAYISNKSTVDYYGIYNGKYISFEAKSTELNIFPLSNIKEHQHQHLKLIHKLGGWSFYILYFKTKNVFILIDVENMDELMKNKKTISFEQILETGFELEIVFPGIIDFLTLVPK